jgi:hypothetical protein
MGVYLCLGQPVHRVTHDDSIAVQSFKCYDDIHKHMSRHGKIFVFLGEGKHKIKKKAEQMACDEAIKHLAGF